MCKIAIQSPVTKAKPAITFYEVDWQVVQDEILALGINLPLGLFDAYQPYYYTTLWGIQEAVKWSRKVYPFPKYQDARMDCDKFAFLMKGLISAEFGLSAFAFQLGFIPQGYHAFNLARTDTGWVIVEPQTGEVFAIGTHGYTLDKAIL